MTFPDPNFRRSSLSLLAVESKTCNLIKVNETSPFQNNNHHYNIQLNTYHHTIFEIVNVKYIGKTVFKRP